MVDLGASCRLSNTCSYEGGTNVVVKHLPRNKKKFKIPLFLGFSSKFPKQPLEHDGGEGSDTVRWIEDGITNKPTQVKLKACLLAVRGRSIKL